MYQISLVFKIKHPGTIQ